MWIQSIYPEGNRLSLRIQFTAADEMLITVGDDQLRANALELGHMPPVCPDIPWRLVGVGGDVRESKTATRFWSERAGPLGFSTAAPPVRSGDGASSGSAGENGQVD